MKLRDHILLGGAAALAAAPVLGVRESGVFWLSSVLIDADHYLDFVYRSRFTEWTPQKMFQFHRALWKRVHDPDFVALSLFHTLEWFLLIGIIVLWSGSGLVFAAMWGMVFHLSLDFTYMAAHRVFTVRALSLAEYFVRRRAIVRRGSDPDRVFRETLAALAGAPGPNGPVQCAAVGDGITAGDPERSDRVPARPCQPVRERDCPDDGRLSGADAPMSLDPSVDRSLSVIVPALNEEGNLEQTVAAVVAEIAGRFERFEILIFDDASTDRTCAIADALSASRPEIRAIHNNRTCGLGYNYRAGVESATCDYVVMVPGDNEVPRDALAAMFDSIGSADIIVPYFTNSWIRPQARQKVSRLFTGLVNRIVGVNLRYFNGPCIHRRDLALAAMPATDGFAYMAVLLARLVSSGFSVRELGVPLSERASGRSKAFRLKNVMSVGVSLLGLAVELRMLRRRWGVSAGISPTVASE